MKKSWNMIPKILSGEKTIESRWYQAKRAPWNGIEKGDTVYFKNSGEPVTASATVSAVMQFTIEELRDAEKIIKKYGKKICLPEDNLNAWRPVPKYCILIFLEHPVAVEHPFQIDKAGFGAPAAWLSVPDIADITSVKFF